MFHKFKWISWLAKPTLEHVRFEDEFDNCKRECQSFHEMSGSNGAAYAPQLDRCIQHCITKNYPKARTANFSKWHNHVNNTLYTTNDDMLLSDPQIKVLSQEIPGAC